MKHDSAHIIYISAHSSYALELFKTRPFDFLIKPFSEQDVLADLHALPSLFTLQECACEVKTISLDKIVREENYGMKIDIEGGEAYLAKNVKQIANARFIVGELHYSQNDEKNKKVDEFFSIIRENFQVEISRPILYFVGNDVELCLCYKAIANK